MLDKNVFDIITFSNVRVLHTSVKTSATSQFP